MSKFMMIAGLLLAAAGVALGVLAFFSPGQLMAHGITPDSAATLLVGGILAIGIGGLIGSGASTVEKPAASFTSATIREPVTAAAAAVTSIADTVAEKAPAAVTAVSEPAKATTADAVAALEKAKTDIAEALGIEEPKAAEKDADIPSEPEEPLVEEPAEEGELFVVEEKIVRGRPARVLSDGTVEAETDEGWMRFENMEHLEEYLDAMEPPARA